MEDAPSSLLFLLAWYIAIKANILPDESVKREVQATLDRKIVLVGGLKDYLRDASRGFTESSEKKLVWLAAYSSNSPRSCFLRVYAYKHDLIYQTMSWNIYERDVDSRLVGRLAFGMDG
ncbi:hypothetical protein Tco_0538425 [Tanacetum coccineum]